MDKLKPVLAQKFWILLGVGLIVSFVGWSMASGEMAATIAKRTEDIKKARDATNIGEVQNETWQAAIGKINEQQTLKVDEARYKLWQDETAVMEWPESMIQYLRKAKSYRGEMNDAGALTVYRNDYPGAFEGVWRTVRPIRPYDQTGIVDFPKMRMQPQRNWGNLTPTYQEIWEAQEDLWLFKSLLKSILAVNGGEEASKLDASIHSILRLELMGGDRSTIDAGGTVGGDAAGMMMGGEDGGAGMMGMPGGAMGAGFGGGGGSAGGEMMGGSRKAASADFDPKDEFGTPGGASAGGGGMAGMMPGEADMAGGDPSGGQTASPPRRYIDDDESQPFQTRGFYLSVVMDHRRVPQLLCELTANEYSPFPVEIVRVQISRLNDDSPGGSQRLLGGMAGGMPGGMPGAGAFAGGGGGAGMLAGEDAGELGGFGPEIGGGFGGAGAMPGMTGGRMGGPDPYLADPFMAQVAISGLMRIYRKASLPVLPGTAAPTAVPEAVPASVSEDPPPVTPSEGAPAEGAPPEGTPPEGSAPGETPAAPAKDSAPPAAAPAEGAAPAAPATGAPPE